MIDLRFSGATIRRLRAILVMLGLSIVQGACASGGTLMLNVRNVAQEDSAGMVRIFVATTRAEGPETALFSGERGLRNAFAVVDVSVPRAHVAGELELPGAGVPIPARHFTITRAERRDLTKIVAEVRAAVAGKPPRERDVLVFVHGFNTTFADAALRFAQIVHDSGFKGVPVLYTWPSRGELLAYPYDRESALYARDFLEANLRAISKDIGAAKVDVLAHSMGTLLTLETLRQAGIRGDASFGGKLRDVILASPDVDLDVFRTQVRAIRRPITVLVSKDDRALAFSRRFAGDKRRLGALSGEDEKDVAELKASGVDIIDLSAVRTSDQLNHAKFAASPKVVALIGRRLAADRGIATRGPQFGDSVGAVASGVIGTLGSSVELVINAPVQVLSAGQAPLLEFPGP